MITLHVHLSTSYPIHLGHSILFNTPLLSSILHKLNKRCAMITDTHLSHSYGVKLKEQLAAQHIQTDLFTISAGEANKTRETKIQLENHLLEKNYARDTCLIALGGGVVTDITGFIAATYCRGVPVIYLPTSLLSMVDASIGGKTGVNTPHGKNMIGCFYQPHTVIMDTALLDSLPDNEWRNGMVEIIKHSVIADEKLFIELETHADQIKKPDWITTLIHKSTLIKKSITEQDEQDHGIRQLLNFGHTIGHAIEFSENYTISHGEAVAIGMIIECYISTQLGLLDRHSLERIVALLKKYQLPLKTSAFDHTNDFYAALCHDKKSLQQIPQFVLLKRIGQAFYNDHSYSQRIEPALLAHAIDFAKSQFSRSSLC